jgi:diguanylate cyclase (GGDEF)-like protein
MPAAPLPSDEAERLASLLKMQVLDTPAEDRFDRLTRLANRHFNAPFSMITLLDEDRQWFKSTRGHHIPETPRAVSFCGYTILQDDTLVVEDASADPRFFDNPVVTGELNIRFYAGIPLRNLEGHRVGTFCILDQQPRKLDPEDVLSLKDLAACAESELQLLRLTQSEIELLSEMDSLRRKASVDPLTRCWNHDAMHEILAKELRRAAAEQETLAVLLFNLDHFAGLNQSWGREGGDQILQEAAERIRCSLEPSDILGRVGGAQFMLIVPRCQPASAQSYAERILGNLRSRPVKISSNSMSKVTASAGLAFWRGRHEGLPDLLARADKALIRAQNKGHDRVEVAV